MAGDNPTTPPVDSSLAGSPEYQAGAALGGNNPAPAQPSPQAGGTQAVGTVVSAPPPNVPVPAVASTAPSATQDNAKSAAAPTKTVDVPAKKGSLGARILSAMSDALGGPKTRDVIDPKTGEKTTVKIGNNMRALHFLGDLMIGESAALGQHGPGHVGKAAEASATAIQQRNNQLFQQDQQRTLQQAQIYRNHMENMQIQQNLGYGNAKGLQAMVENDKPLYDSLVGGNAQDLTADQAQGLGHAQLMDVIKNYQQGGGKSTDLIPVRVGVVPVVDPKTGEQMRDHEGVPVWENSYKLFKDGMVKLTPDQASQFSSLPGVPKLADGQEIRASKLYQLQTESNKIQSSAQIITNSLSENGGLSGGKLDPKDPNTARALENWSGAIARAGGDPKVALTDMDKAGRDTTPIVAAYGGIENINKVSQGIAARKVAAEEQARIQAQSSPEALAAKQKETAAVEAAKQPFVEATEARKAAAQEHMITVRENEKDKRTPVYAEDANGQTILSNRYDHPEGEEVKPGDVNKDRQAMRQLNDVQLNTSRYTKAAQDYHNKMAAGHISRDQWKSDSENIHTLLDQAGFYQMDASFGAGGGHITIPFLSKLGEDLRRADKSVAYYNLSPEGKALYDGFVRTMASIPAYQKALTGIGRSNKEMLDLELANIAVPTMAPQDVLRKQQQFQENIDRATEGFPRLPGLKHPSQTRSEIEGTQQQAPQRQQIYNPETNRFEDSTPFPSFIQPPK